MYSEKSSAKQKIKNQDTKTFPQNNERLQSVNIHEANKPFPSSLEPVFQSESKCEVFEMKMSFHSYGKQN